MSFNKHNKRFLKLKQFKSICLISAFLLISCEFFDHRYKYKLINNSAIDIHVHTVESKNGLIINNKYFYGGGALIQNKNDDFPEWLFRKEEMRINRIAHYSDEGELYTVVDHIMPPYRIYKKANSNILYLVKNNDTLKFIAF